MQTVRRLKKGLSALLSLAILATTIPFTSISVSAAVKEESGPGLVYENETVTLSDLTYRADDGCSAVTIKGNVTLKIVGTVTLIGGKATDTKGGGAGIHVPAGSTLTIVHDRWSYAATLNAIGGAGQDGQNVGIYEEGKWKSSYAGKGGNGAGAGIGGVGAASSKTSKENDCGTIIMEKNSVYNLTVNATGGASGRGGTGGRGGKALAYSSYMSVYTAYIVESGLGGGGGGGGGLPGCGIGGGGGKGGDGGKGGSSETDRKTNGTSTAGGSGGGGGGAGYSPGGGGAGGGAGAITGTKYGNNIQEVEGVGGSDSISGSSGSSGGGASVSGQSATGGKGGRGGTTFEGGTGGDGGSGRSNGNGGGAGQSAGASGRGGHVTVNGGVLLTAIGGADPANPAKRAPGVGSPDTRTGAEGAGTLILHERSIMVNDSFLGIVTDGNMPLYSARLRLPAIEPGTLTASVSGASGVQDLTFEMTGSEAALILFLYEGSYQVTATTGGKEYPFTVEVKDGKATVTAGFEYTDPVIANTGSALEITLIENPEITEDGTYETICTVKYSDTNIRTYTYKDSLVFTGSTAPIRVQNGLHKITLRNAWIEGSGPNRMVNAIYVTPPSSLTINIEGSNNIDATNARICVPKIGDQSGRLTLQGTGHLRIEDADLGAGIGGNGTMKWDDPQPADRDCGTVVINSGSYHITAGVRGHGIGGGIACYNRDWSMSKAQWVSSCGRITINGGRLEFDQGGSPRRPVLAIGGRGNGNGDILIKGGTIISKGMRLWDQNLISFEGGSVVYHDGDPDNKDEPVNENSRNLRSTNEKLFTKDKQEVRVYLNGFTPDKKLQLFYGNSTLIDKDIYADNVGEIGVPMPVNATTQYLAVDEDGKSYSGQVAVDADGNATVSALSAPQSDGVIRWDTSGKKDFKEAVLHAFPNGYCYDYSVKSGLIGTKHIYDLYQFSGTYQFPSTTPDNVRVIFYGGKMEAAFDSVNTTRSQSDGDAIITVNSVADVTMTMSGKNEFYPDNTSSGLFSKIMPAIFVNGRLTMKGSGSTLFRNNDNYDNAAGHVAGQFVLDSGDVTFYGGNKAGKNNSTNIVTGGGEICVNGGTLSFGTGKDATTAFTGKSFIQNGGNAFVDYNLTPQQITVNGGTLTVTKVFSENFISNGGTVSNGGTLLAGTTADEKPVYRAQIPLENKNIQQVLVDGKDMKITSKHTNVADKLYLYMPETSKLAEVQYADGSTKYFLLRKESGKAEQTVIPCETPLPKIDLSASGAEILPIQAGSYTSVVWYNGKAYLANKDFTIIGKTEVNTVKVEIENAMLHLDNVNAQMKDGSPLLLGEQTTIKMIGDNILKGGSGSAGLHVPAGYSVTIDTEKAGTLEAVGGSGAAGIGGNVQEPGGNMTILGGSVSADSGTGDAIGSGSGGGDCGDIVIAGGSVRVSTKDGREFGKAPMNKTGQELSRVILSVDKENPPTLAANGSSVKVDGTSYRINAYHPGDHHFYLYVVKDEHKLQIGDQTFDVAQLHTSVEGSGSLPVYMDDGSLSDWEMISGRSASGVKVQDGDMLVPGTELLVYPTGNGSFLQKGGIRPGRYIAQQMDDGLILVPVVTQGFTDFTNQGWEPVWNADETELQGWRGENGSMTLSAQTDGKSAFRFRWGAQNGSLTGKVFINGQEVLSKQLDKDVQEKCIFFDGTGDDTIELRFVGDGQAFAFPMAAAELYPVNAVTASFAEYITFTLTQPQEGEAIFLYQDNTCTVPVIDIDLDLPGVQLWKSTNSVFVRYQDPSGGNTFDNFTLTFEDGTVETKTDPVISLTADKNVTIGVKTHLTPYYVVVIPESIALNDEEPTAASITASALKNMQTGDTLEISVSGLNENGYATLTRVRADNTLDVPVMDKDKKPLKDGDIVAQFKDNNLTPAQGGAVYFGEPEGKRKAGEYTGTVTFTFAYKEAGN